MTRMRSIYLSTLTLTAVAIAVASGCAKTPQYGTEHALKLYGTRSQVWAVAPALNLSGQRDVDPLLQADILYQHLQEVRGLTAVPVNRVAETYAGLRIEQVQSADQAALVCDVLGCDALVVPTVTAYDPYDPPKFGGSLQLFRKPSTYVRPAALDVRDLARAATPPEVQALPPDPGFVQSVGMYDASNGSVREALWGYAQGRHDPVGPMGKREYVQSMDRFVGFGYHSLIQDLLRGAERADRPRR